MLQSDGFYGKGGKGNYGWLLRADVLNPILVSPVTGMMNLNNLEHNNEHR